MKIVRLHSENVKRLKAVTITPDGAVVTVGGPNDAGKSSVLDSIAMALGGADLIPGMPVRTGEKRAKVVVDLGDLVVTRTMTAAGGGGLEVASKNGAVFKSPQALLDKLLGALTFDPLAFERQPAKAQGATLAALVGLDTADLDARRQGLFDQRTQANREVKALQAQVDAQPADPDAPDEEVSIAAISAELQAAEQLAVRAVDAGRTLLHYSGLTLQAQEALAASRRDVVARRKALEEAEAGLQLAADRLVSRQDAEDQARAEADAAVAAQPDTADMRRRLEAAEGTNVRVRANRQRAERTGLLVAAEAVSAALSASILAVDIERAARLAAVQFPVPGLGLADGVVTLDGLPFDQASTSARLRVSVAIGLAMNPTLRILLVRDGSLLGTENLRLLAEMAAAADAQVWLEMMQEQPDARTSVFIEDGSVRP